MTTTIEPKATDPLETWLSYLEKSHFKPIDLSLERIKGVAEQLDLLNPAPFVITVAGTNGKGSTCRLLEAVLLNMGLRVGVYSSPHLIHYNERVRIQGETLPDEAHVAVFAKIQQKKTASLTYFEFSTLAALALFKQAQLDIVILEVGLGGRLDATNIVDANLAVITTIDIDHVDFLGDDREAIGYEKAGIFRANMPVVIGEPDCPNSVLQHAKALHCPVFTCGVEWCISVEHDRFHWQSSSLHLRDLPLPQIPLPNAGTALAVLTQLPFELSDKAIRNALSNTQITGRFQTLTAQDFVKFSKKRPLARVIIDVGHNPHAARYLAERLHALKRPNQKIYALFSVLADKDLAGIVKPLAELIDEWHCTGLSGYRGQTGAQIHKKLVKILPKTTACYHATVSQATSTLFEQATAQDIVLVFGSFYTVGEFLRWLGK